MTDTQYLLYPNKCKRCIFFSKISGEIYKQWCPDGDCYVEICVKCGTPEKGFRNYKVKGAVFD